MLEKIKYYSAATIIESLVAIGLISLITLIFGASYTIIITNKYLNNKSLAYNLATEEIEALRNTPFPQLTNRIDSEFIEVAYNKGYWSVQSSATAPSSPNVYELASTAGNPTSVTGIAVVPGFDYEDFTYETKIKVLPDSPANWQAGVHFRYHDTNNYYRAFFSSSNLYLDKKVNGVESSLNSKIKSFSTNTWYKLKIISSSDSFEVYVNDILELSGTDNDNSFSSSRLTLLGNNSVHAQFDDTSVTSGATVSWNFDSDLINSIPSAWVRFGIHDLPQGNNKLTIEDAEISYSNLKKVLARVEWQGRNKTHFIEVITLITNTPQ